ncbi:MAG: CvpA family protein [bacterium]|nr:CvpA family protein [bacterium]
MDFFASFSQFLTEFTSSLNLNLLDFIIIAILIFYAIEGYALGFIAATFDFVSFLASFILGLKFYSFFGAFLTAHFLIPKGFANAFGFFIAAFLFEIIFGIVLRTIYRSVFSKNGIFDNIRFKKINKILGILPGVLSAFVLIAFLLTVVVSLPFSPFLKRYVFSSRIGSNLVANTFGFEKKLNDVFGGAINDTLNFFTIKPGSNEFVTLNFKTDKFSIDSSAEKDMIERVNKERTSRGFSPLIYDESLTSVAREHSEDMLKRGYFSHYTPDGLSPFDRMAKADISYTYAGENLALAPNVKLAMQGLMNSPGHKANILSPNFAKIGIGVIDGGIYGEMFTQEFTN